MTDDLIAFLNARLDEDEAAALAAAKCPGRDWTTLAGRDNREATVFEDGGSPIAWIDDGDAMAVATHMASHDPRRVLRKVTAGRHRRVLREVTAGRQLLAAYQQAEQANPVDSWESDYTQALERAVRFRAAVYSDHPDYQPGWKL